MAKRRSSRRSTIPPGWKSIAEKLVMGYAKRRMSGAAVDESGKEAVDDVLQGFLGFRPLADVDDFKRWMDERGAVADRSTRAREERQRPWWVVLGVPRDSSLAEAKKARNKLLLRYHTDRGGTDVEKVKAINLAYEEAERELA